MTVIHIENPNDYAVVPLLTPVQKKYNTLREMDEILALCESIMNEDRAHNIFSVPEPVQLKWTCNTDIQFEVEISDNEAYQNSTRILTKKTFLDVYNLKIGTQYFWRVNHGKTMHFYTEDLCPRWINAPGYMNIRDIGGYKTDSGKTVKQGLAYRGAKLDGPVRPEGFAALQSLGIRTDIDLRLEVLGKMDRSPLGFRYIHFPCEGYDKFFVEIQDYSVKRFFELLANPEIYPIYFHCAGGADRTGTVAFLLEAILGVSEEDMLKDYEQTELQCPDQDMRRTRNGELFMDLRNYLDSGAFGNGDYREKSLAALARAGVTDETIERIRSLYLD